MRTEPFFIRGIPGESAADMIEQSSAGHGIQSLLRHGHGFGSGMMLAVLHEKQKMMRCGKFRRSAEASPRGAEVLLQHLIGLFHQLRTGLSFPRGGYTVEIVYNLVPVFRQFFRRFLPHGGDLVEDVQQADPGIGTVFREIGTGIDGKLIRGEDHCQRPAAGTGHCLTDIHIHRINIRPFFPVDFNGDVVFVEDLCHLRIFKGFVRHDMAPVACGIANAEEDGFVLLFRPVQSLCTPGIPVYRVVLMLKQIGRFFRG